MISDFSRGYYRMTLDVQEYRGGPVIERDLYAFINQNVLEDSTVPVMMRLGLDGDEMFNPQFENAVPTDVLALPADMFDEPGEKSVYVLKSDYADTVGEYYG